MRDIKFRAYDKRTKKLWQWDELNAFSTNSGSIKEWFNDQDLAVMQFTGLKDEKGVDIYDGDIVKYRESTCLVEWNDGHSDIGEPSDQWGDQLGWQLNTHKLNDMGYYIATPLCSDMLITVLGNLYDGNMGKLYKEIWKRVENER